MAFSRPIDHQGSSVSDVADLVRQMRALSLSGAKKKNISAKGRFDVAQRCLQLAKYLPQAPIPGLVVSYLTMEFSRIQLFRSVHDHYRPYKAVEIRGRPEVILEIPDDERCPIRAEPFQELFAEHIKKKRNKNLPYIVALVLDVSNNCALFDYASSNVHLVDTFVNPLNKQQIRKIIYCASLGSYDGILVPLAYCNQQQAKTFATAISNGGTPAIRAARKAQLHANAQLLTIDGCLAWAQILLAKDPKQEETVKLLMQFITHNGRSKNEMYALIEKVAILFSDYPAVLNALGDLFFFDGKRIILSDYQTALKFYKMATEQISSNKSAIVYAFFMIGQLYLQMNKFRRALKNLEKSVDLDPKNSPAIKPLTELYRRLCTEQFSEQSDRIEKSDALMFFLEHELRHQKKSTKSLSRDFLNTVRCMRPQDVANAINSYFYHGDEDELYLGALLRVVISGDSHFAKNTPRKLQNKLHETLESTTPSIFRSRYQFLAFLCHLDDTLRPKLIEWRQMDDLAWDLFADPHFSIAKGRGYLFFTFLNLASKDSRVVVSRWLRNANDPKIKNIGQRLENAFSETRKSIRVSDVVAIVNDFPDLTARQIEKLFDISLFENDVRLPNNVCVIKGMESSLEWGTLLIGQYTDSLTAIVAFNKTTEKPVWSYLANEKKLLQMQQSSFGLLLVFQNQAKVVVLNPDTGAEIGSIALPTAALEGSALHVNAHNFCYFETVLEKVPLIFGGILENRGPDNFQFRVQFGMKNPGSRSYLLGDFLFCEGYEVESSARYHSALIDQNGKTIQTEEGVKLLLKNGVIYGVERKEGALHITTQELNESRDACIRKELRTFVHPEKNSYFVDLIDITRDGTGIIKDNHRRYFFVDMNAMEMIPGPIITAYSTIFIDRKECAIWSWNASDQMVCKHTKASSEKIYQAKRVEEIMQIDIDTHDTVCIVESSVPDADHVDY